MFLSKIIKKNGRNEILNHLVYTIKYFTPGMNYLKKIFHKKPLQGIAVVFLLLLLLFGSFQVGLNTSRTYFSFNQRTETQSYTPSKGVGQEATKLKNDGKKIVRDWIDIFRNIFSSFDPLFKDFLNLTPQYIDSTGSDIKFTTGSIKSPKPIFDAMMGLSASIITLFIAFEGLKVVSGGKESLREVFKKYLLGVILLFLTGWVMIISIQFANSFTQDILGVTGSGGQSILSEYVNKYLDSLKLQFESSSENIIETLSGANTSNPIEILQAYLSTFATLFPTIIMTILFLLIIVQMAWRWAMLYILAPFAPLAQIFYLAPFKNNITRNYWNTWISNLIQLPIFLIAYKIIYTGFLQNQSNISASHVLLFIVFLFVLWQSNYKIGRIFGDISAISSNAYSSELVRGFIFGNGFKAARVSNKIVSGVAKTMMKTGKNVSKSANRTSNQIGKSVRKLNQIVNTNKESALLKKTFNSLNGKKI
jgi:hypothetical protein